jgi:hypothetical protein
VPGGLAPLIIGAALALAAWCAVPAARDRWLGRTHQLGLAALELVLIGQVVAVLVRVGGGERPAEPVPFTGYLAISVLLLPAALVLSAMERTRWGSVIAAGAAAVLAMVELRARQTWAGAG